VKFLNKIVLVIDDEPGIHELLQYYLDIKGIETISAYTGEEGIKRYKELLKKGKEPGLVVMDLNLSGGDDMAKLNQHIKGTDKVKDGVRTTQKLMDINPGITVWGYTAWKDTQWADTLRKTGVQMVVGRDVSFEEFAAMIHDYLMS
jgi:DNA-binding NarL/FixJ family response regulator